MSTNPRYEENWTPLFAPLVFFLPCFYSYGIRIDDDELLFGYGFRKPWGFTSKKVDLKDLDSIVTGTASWKDNLSKFGGWGIRYDLFHNIGNNGDSDSQSSGWAYNASNGPYVDISLKDGSAFRFASRDAARVEAVLIEGSSKSN
eukprot:CAMPEP_0195524072 /NCGR_PEP_ID=MMETSP0794_2-20130614/23717_1 /TAXON_ID=515487 /ORGANISM="Stephanopyxis turris, Strain CCMP 815" /LENGTH=144 /DNA_ID=CAMNT_0040654219 /DNA_START=115 /DNA_END=549 /DNA_ORIENTATION=+